jgi:hypothetical protein
MGGCQYYTPDCARPARGAIRRSRCPDPAISRLGCTACLHDKIRFQTRTDRAPQTSGDTFHAIVGAAIRHRPAARPSPQVLSAGLRRPFNMNRIGQHLLWLAVAVLGAFAFATVALSRGEAVSALWIVVAASAST